MARIRTLNFLPEVFQTPSNAEFLAATLDQIVNPPSTQKIQGYVGSKLGYGINANDKYVTEPTKERVDYQLTPGVVFTKPNETVAQDFITYPGIVNALKMQGAVTNNNNRLFQSQFYSWDSFTDLDKLINYNQYYWLPDGPPAVTVASDTIYNSENYIVTDQPNAYEIRAAAAQAGSLNPTLTLLRGGIYTFTVNQDTQFWIQGEPGVSGYSPTQPNQPVRDVYGVSNNGATNGVVTFTVPAKDAQSEFDFQVTTTCDVVCTKPFSEVNGQLLSTIGNIDGVTGLEGLRIMFYNTGVVNETGYISAYYNESPYDTNTPGFVAAQTLTIASCNTTYFTLASGTTNNLVVGQTITFNTPIIGGINAGQVYFINEIPNSTSFSISKELNGTNIVLTSGTGSMVANANQGLLEDGYYTTVSDNFYRIEYLGASANPIIRLVPDGAINQNEKLLPIYGTEYGNRGFYKNIDGEISLIPYISAPLNVLYYQDGSSPTKVGEIRLIESNNTNTLNVTTDILGKKNYTSRNGVKFTNGLKVQFNGDVIPTSYLQDQYYVQGVGTSIELVPVSQMIVPEKFTQGEYIPWDMAPYDIGNYEINLYVPVLPDYITIARNSINRNAWSRSNRWFHIDVITATANYNNNPKIANLATGDNKAKRPIIEFYPNLKLFDFGAIGKDLVDFIDTKNTDALSTVPGSLNYYPDIQVYSTNTANIISQVTPSTTTTVTVPMNSVTGTLQLAMYIADSMNILPHNSYISGLTNDGTNYTITVTWENSQVIAGGTNISIVASASNVDNYNLFPGARVIFSADKDINVRNKIYVAEYDVVTEGESPVITLTVASDGYVYPETTVSFIRGYYNGGLSYWFDGLKWIKAQEKLNVNQAPLFDIFDKNGISLGNNDYYVGTSFAGNKLFSYGIGTGNTDTVLPFPIRYSSVANVGDISFDVDINAAKFSYVQNGNPITENVNIGYVYNYTSETTNIRQLGWETAVAPSAQYQVFSFDYTLNNPKTLLSCDVAALSALNEINKGWPRVKVFYNNVYQEYGVDFTYQVNPNSTLITLLNPPTVDTPIQVLVLSDQVSNVAYYDLPINLTNNPLNQDLTSVNVGDIRSQYESIFVNAPNTTGEMFGPNNYRDCGDLVPYGTEIIQNSASLVLPGAFLRNPSHNLFDALLFNSREYIKFKQLLVDTVQNTEYVQRYTPAYILDDALDQIAAAKSEINAFFWSDMVPSKAPYLSNTYVFNNSLDHTVYPLSKVYNFDSANYNSVLVYLRRTVDGIPAEIQLLSGSEYTVSMDSPSLRITIPLLNGDQVVIKEYNQTYGSYVPNTPTKLGLYPSFEPMVVLDSDYIVPTYFIRGHDGSYTKLYGDYIPEADILVDFRDQALLEFEKRIYNNLKLSENVVIRDYEILPGYFRQDLSTYTYQEFLQMYSPAFLNWVGQNRLDYKTQYFSKNNEFTYNYNNSANKIDQKPIEQGYWRGVYQYFYDTTAPNETPWQMLGFADMPTWWTSRYGPAPYTSENLILWGDLEAGYVWNNGYPYIVPQLVRPGLSKIIPVDSAGNLLSPFNAVMGNYNPSTFQKDWKVGDMGPVELSYRRSSTWPFDLMRLFALTRPAEFYNLAVDLDNYKYSPEFNQYLVDNRSHLVINNIEIYGNGTAKTSYINWIVDYEKQQGIDATTNISTMLNNMDVRLVYRLAGFSDKTLLDFFVEKGSPSSLNSSLMIPDESYSVLLYENQPFDKILFSGVIVQKNNGYYTVYGNSQTFAYFTIQDPMYSGEYIELKVQNQKVKVTTTYENTTSLIPYGTKFYSTQEVAQFLLSYGEYLQSQGMIFDDIQNGVHVTWQQMVLEFLYWSQQGWEDGSIVTLNPAAQLLNIDAPSSIVQPLTIHQQNFILNQNLYPIQLNDLCVTRDGTNFNVHTLNAGDTMAYGQFNLSNFEHGIVFDNVTLFNDVLYSTVTGLRQNRIYVRGVKSAEWNGTINAYGFILNQDNVKEFDSSIKYTKGVIVKYKNKYWTSLQVIEPSGIFNEQEWKEINYNDVQKGMLPNASTRAYESTLYYNIYEANLENDADLLGFSLIGYRPRDYLSLIDLTDVAQVQVYKNMIKNKGTRNAVEAFKGVNLPQGGIQYDVYENWAIQSGVYGGVLNQQFVDFRVNQADMTGDPAIVSLTNGIWTEGAQQEVPLSGLYNYNVAPTSPNILTTLSSTKEKSLYPSAGYVNYNDVKMAAYFYSQLPVALDKNDKLVPITNFYVGDSMWLANFKERWDVFRWKTIGEVIQVRANTNNTATVTFNVDHNLKKNDPVAIINFAPNVNGYYLVVDIVSLRQVIINLDLVGVSNTTLQARGLGFAFESQRVATPSDIALLNLTENDFIKNTVWVDENTDGSWAVYRKNINYLPQGQLETNNFGTYGSSVAYTNDGYFISDSELGVVYRYSFGGEDYILTETLTGDTSFGTAIAYANNVYVISQSTTNPEVRIYISNSTQLTKNLIEYQSAIAAPDGIDVWGNKISLSDDTNWLYISAYTANTSNVTDNGLAQVYVYRKQNITLDAGYFVSGETYVITSIGNTDFTLIGAVENTVGITFVATGVGTGTGTATQVTYKFSTIIDGVDLGLVSNDKFGSSLATTYTGNTLVVGAPDVDYDGVITNWGKAYSYARTVQNVEAQYTNVSYQPQTFQLAWTPNNIAGKSSTQVVGSQYIKVASVSDIQVNMPVIFSGTNFGNTGLEPNKIYYVAAKLTSGADGPRFSIKESRSTTNVVTLSNQTGLTFSAYVQTNPLYVTVNGSLVEDNNYATIGDVFYYTGNLRAGDIVNIGDNQFYMIQEFNSEFNNRPNFQYGISLDITNLGSDIVVGSPFEIDVDGKEGAAYNYVNAGAKYGVVIGTTDCNVTTQRKLLLNGYLVILTAGNAKSIAQQINNSKITNIQAASTEQNTLIIQLVDQNLGGVDQKLVITTFEDNVLSELGFTVYHNTQVIKCPRGEGPTQFGYNLKINEAKSLVVAAPVGTRYEGTVFDFTDDANLDNDTIFDNNATVFVDQYPNAGAVYMFDYLGNYNESIANPGAYVYAQSVNDNSTDYGFDPGYGLALDFNKNVVMVGSPNYLPTTVGGKALVFNNSVGVTDWIEFRQSAPIVDIEKIQNTQLYSASSNNTLVNFDYPDPLQNKLLGVVRENLDYVSGVDPANYNVNYIPQSGLLWGAEHVGRLWFNTANVRWFNYHQNDVVYNSRRWAEVFPGSDVAVYSWIASYVLPVNYQGPGVPYDVNQYAVGTTFNSSNVNVPIYYFWVRNTNIIFDKLGKTLSDNIIASYIANPRSSGIPFMAPLLPNTFAMYNSGEYFNANDTVFHIGFANGKSDDVSHTEYTLIRSNYADDFLPGLPEYFLSRNTTNNPSVVTSLFGIPYGLYAKMLDSLSGCDRVGEVVPDPLLPAAVQQGVSNHPRQSFFYDRYLALDNYLSYANDLMAQYPIVEIKEDLSFLFTSGKYFNTQDYWEYVNWWAPGYNNNSKTTLQVAVYGDLSGLTNVPINTLVKVEQNGAGKFEVYRYDGNNVWTRVGLENGTIQFSSYLWDYSAGKLGWSGNFFDTDSFDLYPSEETRSIIRALNEQIYTNELLIHRNKSLILLFEYIQSETIESQNFLPWLNKTSLADVTHTIRELKPYEVFKSDNQVFLSEYINEVKPYHVVIKDFLFKYTGSDVYQGDITDFDVPAAYNSAYQKFISPQLVYTQYSDSEYQYTLNDNIWQTAPYSQWFQNYGLSLGTPVYSNGNVINYVGEPNYPITKLASYVTRGTKYMLVENAKGFPINGVMTIGEEKISYSYVDPSLNLLGGLVRGINGTPISDHLPTEQIFIDLPAIVVLSGGRGYIEPPRITAVIDTNVYPAPIVEAQFQAVMSLDSVLEIIVTNPGKGYATLPEIVIDPAYVITFDDTNIESKLHTLVLFAPELRTGDQVQYKMGTGPGVGRLSDGNWYYINVLENNPNTIIAFYTTYKDAVTDQHRVPISDIGSSTGMTLSLGAKAIAITKSTPTRENIIRMKFDRTTYSSQVTEWEAGSFYGAYYAGSYYNTDKLASTKITLENTTPNINDILASAQAVTFEIVNAENERSLTWSSTIRYVAQTYSVDDSIRLIPQNSNDPLNPEPNAAGTTIGFYKNMPIKFTGGLAGTNIIDGTTYYVSEIINEIYFTISETIDGSVKALNDVTITVPVECYTGQVTDTAVLTVNYPGILQTTQTSAVTNTVTIPLSAIGTGGTNGMYPGVSLYFTATNPGEEVFGNIIENQVYYVNTIIDEQNVTLSETNTNVVTISDDRVFTNPGNNVIYSTNVTAINGSTNVITVDSTMDFILNDKIIFNSMVINGSMVKTFGNIVSGQLYYVSQVISDTEMTISLSENGTVVDLTTVASADNTSALVTNQKNTVILKSATGSMTMNVALPVSPGQVNGQKFEMYQTSQEFTNISTYTVGNLLKRTVYAAMGTNFSLAVNRLAIDDTTWFYKNMPFQLQSNIGGLTAGTTYYVVDYSGGPDPMNPGKTLGNIYLIADSTVAGSSNPVVTGTNQINCATTYNTASLYEGMPITFSGVGLGGIIIGQVYYVRVIVDNNSFTISKTPGGVEVVLTADSGTMAGTGTPYITVTNTLGNPAISLTNATPVSPVAFTQTVTSNPVFTMSYILGGYRAIIQNGGTGFAVTNQIAISGDLVGGTTPANDVTLEVNSVDEYGTITSLIISGTPAGIVRNYYFKIRGYNQFEVYANSLMTVPVSGYNFPYVGFTTTNASAATASNDRITVTDSSIFNVNDPVVFTGNVFANEITIGQTYYIKSIPTSTTVTISATINGSTLNIVNNSSGSMTMAKAGSFAFLSEPFYFAPSIIRFNNRLYSCLVSNNDTEFVIGKWELIDSGDRRINAMDRVVGYYQPTVNMPGRDLTQLFEGVTYPNSTYKGNAFEPSQQFALDVILQDQPFYPADVQMIAMVYVEGTPESAYKTGFYGVANLPENSSLIYNTTNDAWVAGKLTSNNVNVTDIVFANEVFLITSTNVGTPIFVSADGLTWTSQGYYTPWDSTGWGDEGYDHSAIDIAALSLQSAAYFNKWIAVGDSILTSNDTYSWKEVKVYPSDRNAQLYSITTSNTGQFNGVVAVGKTSVLVYQNGLPVLAPCSLITYSTDGTIWIDTPVITDKELYAVASSNSIIVAGGQDGILVYSYNGSTWYGLNQATVTSFSSTNYIINISASGFQVNDIIKFNKSFSTVVAGTTYYVKSVVSPTLITISNTLGGSTKVLSAGSVPTDTIAYNYDFNTIRDLVYANGIWVAVGDNGVIKTSINGLVWTTRTSGTTANLNGVSYATQLSQFISVGDNNTIIVSDDNGVTWTSQSLFKVLPAVHTVKGADFPYGYGPEELVPGVTRDNLAMTVYSRPGSDWPVTEYAHVGYNVVSKEYTPTSEFQTAYTMPALAEFPTQVFVQIIDSISGLGTTLYNGINYTVNWVNKQIILNTPLSISPIQKLRIDVYEAGNGLQLVKSSTQVDPIRTNSTTGFNEIYVNCNYSATIYQGSGVIRPDTFDQAIIATETISGSNRIVLETVQPLSIGDSLTFSGTILGGLAPNTTYYVKTISAVTSSITISNYFDPVTGVAGATIPLTNGTGTMYVNTSIGSDQTWSAPVLFNNGVMLIAGHTSQVTQTVASNNTIITNSTAGMVVNCKVTFSNTMFGNVIQPLVPYYVAEIVSSSAFKISETQGGPVLALTDELGGAEYISFDYGFGIQPNGISAKIVFPENDLTVENNYIVYTLFGETSPVQYGYALPETQVFTSNGTVGPFNLTNELGGSNPQNAIVEINGLRVLPSTYTINGGTNTITFTSAPTVGAKIAVTTYNDTERQYLNTQTTSSLVVNEIVNINNSIAAPTAITATTQVDGGTDQITVASTTGFVSGLPVEFRGTSIGGISTNGTVYYVKTIVSSTKFTISSTPGGATFNITGGVTSGNMTVIVGGQAAVQVTTKNTNGYNTGDLVRINGVSGSTQLDNNSYYVRTITTTTFELYTQPFSSSTSAVNYPVQVVSTYTGGGYVSKTSQLFITTTSVTQTIALASKIVATDARSLVIGTPIYFSKNGSLNNDTLIGGLVQGKEYYIYSVDTVTNQFTVSETRNGEEKTLTNGSDTINATQWNQFNPDRLWVTVNGKRVPSSKLVLNDFNELNILAPVTSGDNVIITSMMPSATPNAETYINFVDELGVPSVYKVPPQNTTWLTHSVFTLSTEISVNDVTKLIDIKTQTAITPVESNGSYTITLNADKRQIKTVEVMNNTTNQLIDSQHVHVLLVDTAPVIKIDAGSYIQYNDSLTITIYEGMNIYINGEEISFNGIDVENNMLTGISRGVNGTAQQNVLPEYATVIPLFNKNKLNDSYYNQTWNSFVYNTVQGDPLQLSETPAANFLNPDYS
jgi:hypothetical protein